MSQEVRAYLDDDLYDEVCTIHEQTGKAKSKIVNENVRDALESTAESNQSGDENWFTRSFGQALFVVGFVIAFYQTFTVGVGVSFIGLGLMIWSQMQEHADASTSYWTAFKRTLGVQ